MTKLVAGVMVTLLHAQNNVCRVPREVRQAGHGVRILACFLPTKRPWRNPIEPHWVHGKRRVAEPARLLSADERERRVGAAFQVPRYDHLAVPNDAA